MRFLRFLVVSGLNTAFGFSAFAFTYALCGLWYPLAAFVSTVAGITFNFFTTSRIVFSSHDNRLLGRFFLVYGLLYGLGVLELKTGLELGVDPLVTNAAFLLPNAVIGYILNKRLVFSQQPAPEGAP